MKVSLATEIVDIHPSAIYCGQVYTQDLVVSIGESPDFSVYDPSRLAGPHVVGTTRDAELIVELAAFAPLEEPERAVHFDREDRPVFRGRVVDRYEEDGSERAILDVGDGAVLFSPRDADLSVATDDFLQISRGTLRLLDVDGRASYGVYLDWLVDGDRDERRMAARYLGTVGSESGLVDMLTVLRGDEDPEVRAEMATALGRIGMASRGQGSECDPRIEPALEEALDDGNETVEEAARLALQEIEESERDHMHSRDW